MKRLKLLFLGVLMGAVATGFMFYKFHPLADQLVQSVLWYQYSLEKEAIYLQNFNWAKRLVEQALTEKKNTKPLAVVVDVDETVLDNSPLEARLIKEGKTFSYSEWAKWVNKAIAQPQPGAVSFTQFCKKHNVEVYYITNRSIRFLKPTVENLKKMGFAYADTSHVLMRTNTGDKTARRNKVLAHHDVVVYMGDNMVDLNQKYVVGSKQYKKGNVMRDKDLFGTKYIVMPNPMYGHWRHLVLPHHRKHMTAAEIAEYKISRLKDSLAIVAEEEK